MTDFIRKAVAVDRPDSAPRGLPIGDRVIELLGVAYRTRRPVLLEGTTGIGKSEIVAEFAARAGIDFTVLDLSLLEPPDLVGLPLLTDGRTRFATPAELPEGGRGVLMLEELNRAEIPVMQPALQLLSARRLHSYELPAGWFCVAAVNPEDGDYQVNRLDPALRSRFLQLEVHADRDAWLRWAERRGVHPQICGTIAAHDEAFLAAPPRSWAYASELLHALRDAERRDEVLVETLLGGYLPEAWAVVVAQAVLDAPAVPDLSLDTLTSEATTSGLQTWVAEQLAAGHSDRAHALAGRIRHLFGSAELREAVRDRRLNLVELERLLGVLPGDLGERCADALVRTRAAQGLLVGAGVDPSAAARSPGALLELAETAAAWHVDGLGHRVRMVVAVLAESVRRDGVAKAGDPALRDAFSKLLEQVSDSDQRELRRALRDHGLDSGSDTP